MKLHRLWAWAIALILAAPAGAGNKDESLISIKFADPKIPEIHVTGVDKPLPYGVYDTPEERLAKDRAALETPPPDLRAYALDWDTHEGLDEEALELAAGAWCGDGYWNGCAPAWGSVWHPPLLRRALRPTRPDPLPLYNITEYNAALGEWRRARERA